MVTQLQPDVRAYLHGGEVIKRYIRVEEVAHEYGFSVEETEYIAKAASSLYKLTRIHLVKKERFIVLYSLARTAGESDRILENIREEVKDTKVEDDSFYLLTLAAVAKELKRRGLAEAKVFLAVGLPLTRFGAEKNDFIKYLTKNKRVSFKYENESYHIEIDDVAVFPQCYAAVVDKIPAMAKKTLIVDIGSWTIDIMPVINKSPDESKCVTIPKGLITCMRSINEQCVRQLNGEVDESEIQNIMRYGRSDIDDEYFAIIKAEIEDFVDKVYNSIREFGYNLKTTPIVFVGGGAVVMKNFGSHDAKNISYNLDVKANARGYEQLATMGLKSTKRLS